MPTKIGPLPLSQQPVTARLAGAGSLRQELEAVFTAASCLVTSAAYRALVLDANVAGKPSYSARRHVWTHLKLRYLLNPDVTPFPAFADAMGKSSMPDDRGLLCFLMLARTDRLFREVTLECLSDLLPRPGVLIDPDAVQESVDRWMREAGAGWGNQTRRTARAHLLSALKDFGVLRGSATKRTVSLRPGASVVTFAAMLGKEEGLTDRQILASRWFRLLGLNPEQVVHLLYAAARSGAVAFRMQADVVEIDLPEPAIAVSAWPDRTQKAITEYTGTA